MTTTQAIGTRLPLGYPGAVTHSSNIVVTNRVSSSPIIFGSSVALNGDNTVSAFGTGNVASDFMGIAVRIVKQQTSIFDTVGGYRDGELTDVLTRGAVAVTFNGQGTPQAGGQVFVRIAENAALPTSNIGDIEAQADGTNTVALTGIVFRTGIVSDGVVEVSVTERRV